MGVLKSNLFTNADPATVAKLEACATGKPSEVSTHFTIGSPGGDHIKRLQRALRSYRAFNHLESQISDFPVDGIYSKAFATAVGQYKRLQRPPILNYAGAIDEIIGIKTIKSLDDDAGQSDGPPRIPITPPDIPFKSSRITRRVFTRNTTQELDNQDKDFDIVALFQGLATLQDSFNDPVSAQFGDESLSERRVAFIDDDLDVNVVDQKTTIKMQSLPNVISSVSTTELLYTYNTPNRVVLVTTSLHSEGIPGFETDKKSAESVPRDVARKSLLLTPPKP